ncbi:MAG: hypothetical protein JWM28_286 [Chitinophagaceae bacterium]|nr:hypothetical protein [Chitinophagaceae bacterium]
MKTFKLTSFFGLALMLVVVSCKKDESKDSTQPGTEVSTSNQVSVTDGQVTEGIVTAMDAADGTEDGSADLRPVSCATITVNVDTKKITIDFGTGCVNPLTGRTRSGKIIVGYTGANYTQATERTIEFVNYKTVDTVTLNGTFTQSNIVRTDNRVDFTLSSSGFTFLFADGKTHTLVTYTRNFVINLGANLRDFSDNTTTISGSTTGINKEGEAYSVTITTPVVLSGACALDLIFYPTTGAYDIKIGSRPKFMLSWGSGACDKIVTVVYLGISIDITLK